MQRRPPAWLSSILPLALTLASSVARAEGALPHLDWDRPIRCLEGPGGEILHLQCDGEKGSERRCLVAHTRTPEGGETNRLLICQAELDASYQSLERAGVKMLPAIAEAPPGFARSERGRAYQTKFDMLNRYYVGGAWSPTFERQRQPASFPAGRATVEAGLDVSVLSTSGRSRHDLRILEGSASFKDFQLEGQLLAYDYQHLHRRPGFWLTSFLGPPKVFPVSPPLGWGFRVLGVEDRPAAAQKTLDLEYGEAHVAWSPWQSDDMYNRIRLEAGADLGEYWADRTLAAQGITTGRLYVGFTSALKSRFTFGETGLHAVTLDFAYRRPTLVTGTGPGGDTSPEAMNRVEGTIAYEGILVAINDQPVSLRLAARGVARDDPGIETRAVELGVSAGLRFSFWAPARAHAPLDDLEEQ